MENQQAFKAISKICLNNWHYIDRKVLTLNEGINFFTGHSGSGKSTVIDALQIVLYSNTDGRGFFNKAAADDSDRSLIEYLRGMVNISENNESEYLRNENFSSTIVIELEQTDTKEKQCVGVVFDVETATNAINRMFFWHTGGLLENDYRGDKRCLSTIEVKEYLQRNFTSDKFFCTQTNERFRRQLYDVYLGGLDMEKFPRLFKRAIPFRMNIKLEDFVKEYICMENDIHIEDLQESITLYGRMKDKIEQTLDEIKYLEEIKECYDKFNSKRIEEAACQYDIKKLEILQLKLKSQELIDKIKNKEHEITSKKTEIKIKEDESSTIQEELNDIIARINNSGYETIKERYKNINEIIERLYSGKHKWQQISDRLAEWKRCDIVSNSIIWDIDKFIKAEINNEEIEELKESLEELKDSLEEDRGNMESSIRKIKKEEAELRDELSELKMGHKAYPKDLEEAKYEIRTKLTEKLGKFVNVQILADLLDIKDESWHNSVEGYLGNNKLVLVVEPKYVADAMDIYETLDKKKYFRVSVLDTEKVLASYENGEFKARENSLAKEVTTKEDYVRAYVDFVLGNVIKCENVSELRKCKIGITKDCMLYKGFRLQHINPDNYTRHAYIGETSVRQRMKQIKIKLEELQENRVPQQEEVEKIKKLLHMEFMSLDTTDYVAYLKDVKALPVKEKEKEDVKEKLRKLEEDSIQAMEEEKAEIESRKKVKDDEKDALKLEIGLGNNAIDSWKYVQNETEKEVYEKEKEFKISVELEKLFNDYLESKKSRKYDYLRGARIKEAEPLRRAKDQAERELIDIRNNYLRKYVNRSFSATIETNEPYDELLKELSCDNLEKYKSAAKEQARAAVEYFKDDFIYKIRDAIKEAYRRKDELNKIISSLDFGKDKYKFVITKNKGADGKFYSMFMDDNLSIDPSTLTDQIDNQLNMFTMEHEEKYGDLVNELIGIFIPPDNATREEMEEAKRNMKKYADYRTYLSFDMQQIVSGENDMTIGLSKMISKNSGGEGQNPLYVALLASFAQLYRINLSPKVRRNPTIRLVVLDEAFSKMDAEKVASCISLIRGLGFQAIISATNDKIQNYLENVDKTFVYANPNKKHISIQEFEKNDFKELS